MKKLLITLGLCLLSTLMPSFVLAQIHTTSSHEVRSYGGGGVSVGGAPYALPTVSFRSTSTGISASSAPAVGFVRISAKPMLNDAGYAQSPYATTGPLREREHTGTPPGSAGNQIPLGDGLIPLLLFAAGYAIKRRH